MGYIGNSPEFWNLNVNKYSYTATAGQTIFPAVYDSAVDVYLNGSKLQNNVDYIATDGVTVVLSIGASLDDVVDINGYFNIEVFDITKYDGPGSGLDADLLDGQHGSYYTTAGNLTGTIPSTVLGNSTVYIGTTGIALNRASDTLTLNGVSIDGNAATSSDSSKLGGNLPSYYAPLASPTFTGTLSATNVSYTGTLTGSTGIINIGSGQLYKDASGNLGVGTSGPSVFGTGSKLCVVGYVTSSGVNYSAQFSDGITNTFRLGHSTGVGHIAIDSGDIAIESDGVERARIDSSSNLKFNSGYGAVATAYGCRAWVNFNGSGTVAIRASGNVSSITDNGTGDYTVNFTTAMPDQNYSYSHAYSDEVNVQHTIGFFNAMAPGALRVRHFNVTDSTKTTDKFIVEIAVFR